MPKIKPHGTYVHDLRRFDLTPLCDVSVSDAATLLGRAADRGFVEHDPRGGTDLLGNKEFVVLDKLGDRALVLHNHDGALRLKVLSWAVVRHLWDRGADFPTALCAAA